MKPQRCCINWPLLKINYSCDIKTSETFLYFTITNGVKRTLSIVFGLGVVCSQTLKFSLKMRPICTKHCHRTGKKVSKERVFRQVTPLKIVGGPTGMGRQNYGKRKSPITQKLGFSLWKVGFFRNGDISFKKSGLSEKLSRISEILCLSDMFWYTSGQRETMP